MSTEQRNPISLPSATAFAAASLFCGVGLNTSGQLVLPSANAPIIGVLYAIGATGQFGCEVYTVGEGKLKARYGGTVTANDPLKVNSSGQFITASASDVAAGFQVAIAVKSGSATDIGEVVLTGGSGQAAIVGSETITSGAMSLATSTTNVSTTGSVAYTLANGIYVGQRKTIKEITAATTPQGTLTITTTFNSEPTVYVWNAIGQEIELEWTATGWHLLRKIRAGATTVVVGTTVLTGMLLNQTYNLSVTGTVLSNSGTLAIQAPTLSGEYIRLICTVAASTPAGTINVTGFTKALVAATAVAGINATTATASFISNGASWDNEQLTTATYA